MEFEKRVPISLLTPPLLILTPPFDHGARWFYVNRHQKTGRNCMRKKAEAFKQIWEHIEVLTGWINAGASIALYWPTSCSYRSKNEVVKLLDKRKFEFTSYSRYVHVKDEWHKDEITVGSNNRLVLEEFSKLQKTSFQKAGIVYHLTSSSSPLRR